MSRLLLRDEVGGQAAWAKEVSSQKGRDVRPVLLQRCHAHEIVWFSSQQAVGQRQFHALRTKFPRVQFTVHSDRPAIHVRQEGRIVALIWPCAVPDPHALAAMRHEMALRRPPPADAKRLKTLVVDHLNSALGAGAQELWQATHRLLDWLEGRGQSSYVWDLQGITEWRKCSAVELLDDAVYVFKGTSVPVDALFQSFNQGQNIAEFLKEYPAVHAEQVSSVLGHLAVTLCG